MILVASLKYRKTKRSKTKLLHEHVTTEIWCPTAVSCVDSLICNKEWAVCLHPSAYFYWVCGNSVSLGFLLKWSSGYKCYWGRLTCLCTQRDCINLIPLGNKTKTSLFFFFPAFLTISIDKAQYSLVQQYCRFVSGSVWLQNFMLGQSAFGFWCLIECVRYWIPWH